MIMEEKFLIVGLGNPGEKYKNTRHNVGFLFIDYIYNFDFEIKFNSFFKKTIFFEKNVIFLKPLNYMNLSGIIVKDVLDFYKIDIKNLVIILDDINFPIGKLRIRKDGSHGGHNGLKNIIENLNTSKFIRIKIGVGKKPDSDLDLSEWVLSKFTKDELSSLNDIFSKTKMALNLILNNKPENAMNNYN